MENRVLPAQFTKSSELRNMSLEPYWTDNVLSCAEQITEGIVSRWRALPVGPFREAEQSDV